MERNHLNFRDHTQVFCSAGQFNCSVKAFLCLQRVLPFMTQGATSRKIEMLCLLMRSSAWCTQETCEISNKPMLKKLSQISIDMLAVHF